LGSPLFGGFHFLRRNQKNKRERKATKEKDRIVKRTRQRNTTRIRNYGKK
jgi:hypothetical protein